VASRTDQARELALRLVDEHPGIQQRDLVAAVQEKTDLATSTITRMLQVLERDGVLEGRLDGRRKAYALGSGGAPAQEAPRSDPAATTRGSRGELVAVVTALFIAASLVAFVLAPDKNDDSSGGSAAPVAEPAPEPPTTQAKLQKKKAAPAKKRRTGTRGLAAAKHTQVAVLSGSPVQGIASKTGSALKRRGFRVGTVGNAPGPSDRSVVLYARGKHAAAKALAASIGIRATKAADPASQSTAQGAGLIVVVGADRRR
jgi:hypothetical protein